MIWNEPPTLLLAQKSAYRFSPSYPHIFYDSPFLFIISRFDLSDQMQAGIFDDIV